ncbi:hypothetical protein PYW07_003771 [Mythimna separata]|uniref:MADF domain-containing protein n=1 Tax=Mythimna separata TaxID=271217 RepID=A0AAD7YNE8_MYTSE|nr:hypothetical protein PYW07_003771 [Mythimna separata]
MADMRTWNKAIVTELISIYQSHPCLWKVKSAEYKNKILKEAAYDELIAFCKKKGFIEANRDFVVKKIQSLRSSFRKEMKKVTNSQRSGSGKLYKSSLWYFKHLLFTKDQEFADSMSNIEEDVEPEDESLSNDDETNGSHEEEEQNKIDEVPIEMDAAPYSQRQKRKFVPIHQREVTADPLRANAESLSDFYIAGMNVAKKLAKMDPLQAIYAESLVNNVLTKGLLNKLKEDIDLCDNHCNRRTIPHACENRTANTSMFQFGNAPRRASTQMHKEEENQDIKPIIIS